MTPTRIERDFLNEIRKDVVCTRGCIVQETGSLTGVVDVRDKAAGIGYSGTPDRAHPARQNPCRLLDREPEPDHLVPVFDHPKGRLPVPVEAYDVLCVDRQGCV